MSTFLGIMVGRKSVLFSGAFALVLTALVTGQGSNSNDGENTIPNNFAFLNYSSSDRDSNLTFSCLPNNEGISEVIRFERSHKIKTHLLLKIFILVTR